uniref:Uncharacterized protein n=1 Tax=Neisseria meningitidis alpha275 TaxID=295996 RepID=C6SKF4_NEIME|nr:hypothetical protein predicted by Glimmer/Critica [Neisseria meningitidis alpha275]
MGKKSHHSHKNRSLKSRHSRERGIRFLGFSHSR